MSGDKCKMPDQMTFRELFEMQKKNQDLMILKGLYGCNWIQQPKLPIDDVGIAKYHVLQLMSEIGEVLDADKRWKNFRNDKYDKPAKAEEIADCFIVLMNVAMFSGIDSCELVETIENKIKEVQRRVNNVG